MLAFLLAARLLRLGHVSTTVRVRTLRTPGGRRERR
jgi:hypothetical protein